jgi:hypothetical protein
LINFVKISSVKKFAITGFIILVLVSIRCMSQVTAQDTLPPSANSPVNPSQVSSHNKLKVNVTVGTEFWTAPHYTSGIATYLTTGLSYPVSKRFSVGGGIGVINTTPVGSHATYGEYYGNTGSTNALIYVTGQYLLSQRLTVTGTLFKEFSIFSNSPQNQHYQNNLPQGGYMKINYKINDFMQIEAGVGYSRGVSPYYNSFIGSPLYYNRSFPFINP